MKEITRIHIAKVAYDIELDAKKDVEQYIGALERYADDPEILDDIEIRITELLAERGVAAGGVIAASDVAAVREILGEPSDFAAEGASEATGVQSEPAQEPRRVYRDTDRAVAGGVLAGFARFFGIDPLWARLVFIVLLFASFGTVIVIYLILWLIIPPARTAAERLYMTGRAVTLASIKELAGNEELRSERAKTAQRALGFSTGLLLVLLAIGGLLAIAAVVSGIVFGYSPSTVSRLYESWWFMTMMGLFVISGLLFSALCFVLASAVFRRQWTKRVGTAVVAIIVAGLVVFASGVGFGMYGRISEQARHAELRETTQADLPANFSSVKNLSVLTDEAAGGIGEIEYIVSDELRFELESFSGARPKIEVADDNLSATVQLVQADDDTRRAGQYKGRTLLKIYGPALDRIDANNNTNVSYYNERAQDTLAVTLRAAGFELRGTYDEVTLANKAGAVANIDRAAIGSLMVSNEGGLVEAGVVRNLSATQPDACPATSVPGEPNALIRVRGVTSGAITYNGVEQPAQNASNECGAVRIGAEE